MKTKAEVIAKIKAIQSGGGVKRDSFPDSMKGEIPKAHWDDGLFTLGLEYGYMIALMDVFEITEGEITCKTPGQ